MQMENKLNYSLDELKLKLKLQKESSETLINKLNMNINNNVEEINVLKVKLESVGLI